MRDFKFRYTQTDGIRIIQNIFTLNDIERQLHRNGLTIKAIEQYTGMKDKNGKEIYEGDIVRVHLKRYGEDMISLFKVMPLTFRGLRLRIIKLLNQDFTFLTELSFEHETLCVDYANQNYDRLSVAHKYERCIRTGENTHVHEYSNDITIIGNIHQKGVLDEN